VKTTPSGETKRKQARWRLLVAPLLATVVSALTVLGAVLLSLQSQVQSSQVVVQVSKDVMVEVIPTADIVTAPPLTLIPTWETPVEASPTPVPSASASPALAGTTAPRPTFTPLPCAGGAPLHWKLYIVQAGDTLFSLARRHGTTVDQAVYYNCLQSEQVWAGQRLYLPPLPTPVPSFTPTPTPLPTPVPASPTATPLPTPAPTWTDTPAPLPTSTGTAAISPTATITATATPVPTATSIISPTATPEPSPTPVISPTTTPEPIASPTLEPTASPTPEPTVSPTPEPIASPTPEPTASPTPEPTATPTPGETPEP
jgi:LysM repeat protein